MPLMAACRATAGHMGGARWAVRPLIHMAFGESFGWDFGLYQKDHMRVI